MCNVPPRSQVRLECSSLKFLDNHRSCNGLVLPLERLGDKCSIVLTSSLSKIEETGTTFISAVNLSHNQLKLSNQKEIVNFEFLNEAQAGSLIEVEPHLISLAKYAIQLFLKMN